MTPHPPVGNRAAHLDGSPPLFVDLGEPLGGIQDLPSRRKVRSPNRLRQLAGAERRIAEKPDERPNHLEEVVGRDVGGDSDRDPGGPVDQQQRQPGGKDDRFGAGPVIRRTMGNRVQPDLAEHILGGLRQPAFGVTHRRRRIAVEGAEVARALDQGQPGRKRLRHPYESFVDGRVAVRVVATHHISHHLRALAEATLRAEPVTPHGGEDPALHRFETVAHVGQRPAADDRKRVCPVPILNDLPQGGRNPVRAVIRPEREGALLRSRHGLTA